MTLKKKLIFLLILLIIPLVSALDEQTIIGRGGDEELIIDWLGDEELFFMGTIEVSGGGGGGGGITSKVLGKSLGLENISIVLCNLTYNSADRDLNKYIEIEEIQTSFLNITNKSASWTTVRLYIDNWQGLCSDLLNRSLNEDFLCNEIFNFVEKEEFKIDFEKVNNLSNQINKDFLISQELVTYYLDNFKLLCSDKGFTDELKKTEILSIIDIEKIKPTTIYIILIFLVIIFVIAFLFVKIKKLFYVSKPII